ncbi:MAG: hypothetical protein U1F51_18665 [Burkholderiales bacterium]
MTIRFLLPALLGALLLSPDALAVQDCELNGESVNPANGSTTRGKTGLMRCRDRDSGKVVREEELRQGEYVGLVRYYRGDGAIEKEYSRNARGNMEGVAREYHPGGRQLAREDSYIDGRLAGVGRAWHPNGAPRRVAAYGDDGRALASAEFNDAGQLKDLRCAERAMLSPAVDDRALCGHGAPQAVTVALHTDRGALRGRVSHRDGRRTASESLWENGQPREQEEIGERGSVERVFSRDGVKLRETRWLAVDRGRIKEAEQTFHESGPIQRDRRWSGEEPTSDTTFYLNGQKRTDHRYGVDGGRAVCETTEFHDNGRVAARGRYGVRRGAPDKPFGVHQRFDVEGRRRAERTYDDAGRLKREAEWDEAGRLLRDDEVFEDGSRKAFTTAPPR